MGRAKAMKRTRPAPFQAHAPGILAAIRIATIAEIAFVGAAGGLLGLAGRWSPWLDLFAQGAPLWLALSAAGGLLALGLVEPGGPRGRILAIAAAGLIAGGVLIGPELYRAAQDRTAPPAKGEALTLLTFNVWDENIDKRRTVDAALASGADVIAMQEHWGLGQAEFARLWGAYRFRTRKDDGCDVVIFSRRPIQASQAKATRVGEHLTCIVWARTTDTGGRPVTVASTHLAWPIPPGDQARQRALLAASLRGLDKRDLFLAGDFNTAPWSRAMHDQDALLAPLQRRTHALLSWPANLAVIEKPAPFPLLAIDHIYAGPAWKTQRIERLARAGSDHYGVLATFIRTAP
jgi:endonuclease/exonuclease/phosphatase (EEP) superfamily protein YafD